MFLGIEIGGTKLQLGLGRGDGLLLALWRGTVDAAAGGEGTRRQIVAAISELLAKAGVAREGLHGIGVGFGGPTDDATQSVIKSHHIAGWDGFPLASWLTELVGLPTVVCNDADVAGLAEALFGAGNTKFVAAAQFCLVFAVLVPLAWLLSGRNGLNGMWSAAVAYAIGACIVMTVKFRGGTWKEIKL